MRAQRQLLPTRLAVIFALMAAVLAIAVPAAAASTIRVAGGATTLKLDSGAVSALKTLKIGLKPVPPAKAVGVASVAFPVTRGYLDSTTLAGAISHRGGLSLSKGHTRVNLVNFIIRTDKQPRLTARVGASRVAILNLDLSQAKITNSHGRLIIAGVSATFTKAAADALNAAFKTNAFVPGFKLGTATVRTHVVR